MVLPEMLSTFDACAIDIRMRLSQRLLLHLLQLSKCKEAHVPKTSLVTSYRSCFIQPALGKLMCITHIPPSRHIVTFPLKHSLVKATNW